MPGTDLFCARHRAVPDNYSTGRLHARGMHH
jgi:hypothetical protein